MSDPEFVTRIERCLRDADPDLANMWRECVVMFGVRSAAAVGCLLGLVRKAWANPDVNACKTSDGRFWGVRCPGFSGYMGTGAAEIDALTIALESAPS